MLPNDFILNSDNPIDKVIYRSSIISFTIPAFGFLDSSFAHGNGGAFLPLGQYSLSPTFASGIYDSGTSPSTPGIPQIYTNILEVDATTVYYNFTNNTGSSVTFYLRLVGLAIPNTSRDVDFTSQYQDLILNTDLNYMKLIIDDTSSVAADTATSIPYILPYTPKVLLWQLSAGRYSNIVVGSRNTLGDSGNNGKLENGALVLSNNTPPFSPPTTAVFFYKVYE